MRHRLIALFSVALLFGAVPAQAQIVTYEKVTFADTAVGFTAATLTDTASGAEMQVCTGKLETAAIRIRYDGTAPTASVGIPVSVGEPITIRGLDKLKMFKGIRTTGTSGVVEFQCSPVDVFSVMPAVSATITGGDASAANQVAQTDLLTTIDSDTSRLTSSAASAAPAAPLATTAILGACTYTAAGVTFTNTQQGGLTCDSTGALRIAGSITAAASTTDADDGSIASGQTNDNVNALGMAYSGSAWSRLTFGSAGTASSQVWTVQGIANGTVIPVNVSQIGGSTPPVATCDSPDVSSVAIDTATAGNVQLVALSGTTVVYVCGFNATSAADVSVQFVSGTGTACATGETNKTGLYQLSAASGAGIRGLTVGFAGATVFKGAAGEAVCIELSGAVQVDGILTYVQR